MECIIDIGAFDTNQIQVLGHIKKFKKVHHLSCMTMCDGQTNDPEILAYSERVLL